MPSHMAEDETFAVYLGHRSPSASEQEPPRGNSGHADVQSGQFHIAVKPFVQVMNSLISNIWLVTPLKDRGEYGDRDNDRSDDQCGRD